MTARPEALVLTIDHSRVLLSYPWTNTAAIRDAFRRSDRPEINTVRYVEDSRLVRDEIVDWTSDWYLTDGRVVEVISRA